jgi:hypothetical protein
MSQSKQVIRVGTETTPSEILEKFLESDQDLVFVDQNTLVSVPHLELLTDFPRGASAALVGTNAELSDTLVRAGQVVSASSSSHTVTTPNRVFTGAIYLSQKQPRNY